MQPGLILMLTVIMYVFCIDSLSVCLCKHLNQDVD